MSDNPIKLEGKWHVSVWDDKETSTYADATDVRIFGFGRVLMFASGGKTYVTSLPWTARALSKQEVR